jgi:hypothetical protein
MSRYNNNGSKSSGNGSGSGSYSKSGNSGNQSKFCAVCHAAGRPDYDTHYVRADKFDRSSAITCPYLNSIECRICGETGHTSSYCTANNSSSTAAPVASLARVRLPPISSSSSSSSHSSKQIPRIVFPALEKEKKEQFAGGFPELSNRKRQSTQSLPPLSFVSIVSRFHNDEPLLRRGPPEASPVHSPAAPSNKVVYNKRGNVFADLVSSSDEGSPVHSPAAVGRYRATKPASWKSLDTEPVVVAAAAAVAPVSKFPPRVVVATVAPLAPLPPLAFKPRKVPASTIPKEDKKKLWGDTDSEDDEEFLKRGLE